MESRDDWASILLDGLPAAERQHALAAIAESDRISLERVRRGLAADKLRAEIAAQRLHQLKNASGDVPAG